MLANQPWAQAQWHKEKEMPDTKKMEKKVAKVMREYSKGTLKSGSGKKVTTPAQAKAIAMSEGRKAGGYGK